MLGLSCNRAHDVHFFWSAQAILSAVHAHSFWQWRFPAANRATIHNEGLHNIAPRKVNCWNRWNPKIVDDARVKPFSRLPWCLDKLKDFAWHIHWICVSNNSLLIWLSIWGCAESRSMINSLSAKKTSHIYRSLEIHFEVSSQDFSGLARQWWAPYVAWLWLSFSSSYHDPTGTTQWEGHSNPKRGFKWPWQQGIFQPAGAALWTAWHASRSRSPRQRALWMCQCCWPVLPGRILSRDLKEIHGFP